MSIASSALLEYELLLKSRGYPENDIRRDIEAFRILTHDIPLSSEIIVRASEIREKFGLSYFDSLHAATALAADGVIISTDKDYKRVDGLKVIKPEDFVD